ncbi:MAG: cupin domain-containing protein [Gammaproteobacteria bacterium]|nr:cupin domain-containing protein [Gammaproteobacteria bacterium]
MSIRRIVTGHDTSGASVIQEDGAPPRVRRVGGAYGPLFHEIWHTRETPARIDRRSGEPAEEGIQLAPPRGGTRIRVLDIPPEDAGIARLTPEQARAHFAEVGAGAASSHSGADSRHAFMHRTETIDYGIVLEGELTLVLDRDETVVRAGDIVIQRGTNHGWANRSGKPCRIAFILIDGEFTDGLG